MHHRLAVCLLCDQLVIDDNQSTVLVQRACRDLRINGGRVFGGKCQGNRSGVHAGNGDTQFPTVIAGMHEPIKIPVFALGLSFSNGGCAFG